LNNKKITIIFAFLMALSLVDAFELTSPGVERTACQGDTVLFVANVFGSGDFSMNLDGSASSWSVAVPQSFSLDNEGRAVYVYATPNSNVNPGVYSLNLYASNNQETKTIPFVINVNSCHDIRLVGEASKSICLNDITQFNYQIENLADYQETLELNLNGPYFVSTPQSLIALNPGEAKNIQVNVNQNNQVGDYEITLSASNEHVVSEITSNLGVSSCYEFTVTSEKDFTSMCENSQDSISFIIKNTGVREFDYSLSIDAPEWANLDLNTFTLNQNEEQAVSVVFSPPYGVEGNFRINLDVNGFEKEFNVEVNKCHGIFIDIIEKSASICNNIQTPVYMKNTGLFEKEYNLQTSEEWAGLDKYNVKLQPNEELNLNLVINPQNLEINSYDVYVRAIALDSSAVSSEDKIRIDVLDNQNCYLTRISAKDLDVNQDSSATLPITIANDANEKILYQISLTGNAASFSQLNPSIIEVNPKSSETVYLYAAPSLNVNPGSYLANIDISLDNVVISSKTINIDVNEMNIARSGQVTFLQKIENFFVSLWNSIFSRPVQVNQDQQDENTSEESVEAPQETEEANQTSFVNRAYEIVKGYWIYILIIAVIVIVALIALPPKSKGKDEAEDFDEDFDEELEEEPKKDDEKPLRIGRWALGIVIILALIWTQMQYGWFNYIKNYGFMAVGYAGSYKVYILGGLIIILIAILIIKYWKAIVDFFEEEEEKPKRKRKKK